MISATTSSTESRAKKVNSAVVLDVGLFPFVGIISAMFTCHMLSVVVVVSSYQSTMTLSSLIF